jgi:FKBP-type peptidyl-prolyl cis-trans isomerase
MKYRNVAVVVVLAAMLGCLDPPELMPVAPPGVELKRMPVIPESEGAQALGEQPAVSEQASGKELLSTAITPPTKVGELQKTTTGIQYTTLKEGTGAEAKPGQTVKVHYVGTLLTDGTQFGSSRAPNGGPMVFKLGIGKVIKGWDEGVSGMHVGEVRKLVIPPELGYGSTGSKPEIPPNATLVFEVELLETK